MHSGFFQPELEALLLDRMAAHPKIQLLRGWYVKDAVSGPEGAETTARRPLDGETMTGKTNVFRSAFVVGANSMVRDRIGSDQHDLGFSFDCIVVDFRPNTPLQWDPHLGQRLDPARPTTFTTAGPTRGPSYCCSPQNRSCTTRDAGYLPPGNQ